MFREFFPAVMVGWLAGLLFAGAFTAFLWGFRFFPAIRFRVVLVILMISLGVASFASFTTRLFFILWAGTNGEGTIYGDQAIIIAAITSFTSACALLFVEKDRQMGMRPRRPT